jgi:hypothetical protein
MQCALTVMLEILVGHQQPLEHLSALNVQVLYSINIGFHRKLGTHIAKVRSVTLDTWTQEQLALYQYMGKEWE